MSFLPDDYESPHKNTSYMKLEDGENKIRILSSPLLGWEDWKNQKPVRFPLKEKPVASVDPTKPVRFFWAMIVWNYNLEQIQIYMPRQAGIIKPLEALAKDKDWGSPCEYDVKIVKSGNGKETKYMVSPLPHKPVTDQIQDEFYNKPINLQALMTGDDPFAPYQSKYTEARFKLTTRPDAAEKELMASRDTISEMRAILSDCDPSYSMKVQDTLKGMGYSLDSFPLKLVEKMKPAALKNRSDYQSTLVNEECPF